MSLLNKALISGCAIIATTIVTEFCTTSSASAYSLDWGRNDISWDASAGELTNIYEFDPQYKIDTGNDLYVRFTLSTNPSGEDPPGQDYAIQGPNPRWTPGIYQGGTIPAGTGFFTDELFVFTNRNTPTPDNITLTIEFFEDDLGTIKTEVEDFNTTFADLDAGANGVRQEFVTVNGEDILGAGVNPTFAETPNSLVGITGNTIEGYNMPITDTSSNPDAGNVRVLFDGNAHKVNIDFVAAIQGQKNRNMYMTDIGITPTLVPVTPVPFEFSPAIGIVMSLGLLGSNYLRKKYL